MNEGDGGEPELALCEIGSVPLPDGADWLIAGVAGFQAGYGELHPYLAVALCIAGMLMNFITVVVLTRPSMISPVNVLLCAVAVCDIIVMGSYLVFVVHFLLAAASRCLASDYSYAWALFTMFHAHASVIFHATSIWLTVSLAQIRVLTIRRATIGPTTNISGRFTAVLAIVTCLIMTLVNLPNFLTFEVMEVPSAIFLPCLRPSAFDEINSTSSSLDDHSNSNNVTTGDFAPLHIDLIEDLVEEDYSASNNHTFARKKRAINNTTSTPVLRLLESFITSTTPIPQELIEELSESTETLFTVRAQENDCMKLKLAFWSNGMIFKVVPCLLLTVSIVALLNIIADVSHKRRNLAQVMKKKVPKDHTTPMLAAVLSIFLIAELPQGVMLVLTGIFSSETFHKKIYLPLGDFMDILSLLNSAIGFLIYVGMSRKFRSVFFQLFFSCLRWTFIVNKTSSGCFQFHVERGPQNGSGETGDRPSAFFNCNPKDKGDRLCQYRNLQHRSSRFTTNDNTRTEQLSHYPSTTSTLNAYGGLCAAATASAAAQLGSHLMFFDSSQTVSVKLPVQSSHLLSPQNAYLMPPSTKPPILKDSHSSVDTTETPRNELTVDSKPAKRISFNLSYNDSHSNTSKSGLLPLYFAVKKQNQQVAQQSTSHILPDPNSTMTYETENVKSEKKTVTVKTVKKNSVIGVMRRLFWPDEEIEAEIYKQNVDCVGSTSPQRKRTILQTELNLVGTFLLKKLEKF